MARLKLTDWLAGREEWKNRRWAGRQKRYRTIRDGARFSKVRHAIHYKPRARKPKYKNNRHRVPPSSRPVGCSLDTAAPSTTRVVTARIQPRVSEQTDRLKCMRVHEWRTVSGCRRGSSSHGSPSSSDCAATSSSPAAVHRLGKRSARLQTSQA